MTLTLFADETSPPWLQALAILLSASTIGAVVYAYVKVRNVNTKSRTDRNESDMRIRAESQELDQQNESIIIKHLRGMIRSLEARVKFLEEKDEQHDKEMSECKSERAALTERIKWLEQERGKP